VAEQFLDRGGVELVETSEFLSDHPVSAGEHGVRDVKTKRPWRVSGSALRMNRFIDWGIWSGNAPFVIQLGNLFLGALCKALSVQFV